MDPSQLMTGVFPTAAVMGGLHAAARATPPSSAVASSVHRDQQQQLQQGFVRGPPASSLSPSAAQPQMTHPAGRAKRHRTDYTAALQALVQTTASFPIGVAVPPPPPPPSSSSSASLMPMPIQMPIPIPMAVPMSLSSQSLFSSQLLPQSAVPVSVSPSVLPAPIAVATHATVPVSAAATAVSVSSSSSSSASSAMPSSQMVPTVSVSPALVTMAANPAPSSVAPLPGSVSGPANVAPTASVAAPAISAPGVWTAKDDRQLKEAVATIGDFDRIHKLVPFSQRFTRQEIEGRWASLLYDGAAVSLSGVGGGVPVLTKSAAWSEYGTSQATAKKKPGPKAKQPRKALNPSVAQFIRGEDAALHQAKAVAKPVVPAATAVAVQTAASITPTAAPVPVAEVQPAVVAQSPVPMRPVPVAMPMPAHVPAPAAAPAPSVVPAPAMAVPTQTAMQTTDITAARKEYKAAAKSHKRATLKAEKEVERDRDKERDNRTLGVLRGRKLRYLMRTKEAVIGRKAEDSPVDVDIAEEGPAGKVSRRHAIVKLKHDGEFYVKNVGKRALYVNGHSVSHGEKRRLQDGCLIDICDLRLIFDINKPLLTKIKRQLQQQQQQQPQLQPTSN